jgi:hypothetical protein
MGVLNVRTARKRIVSPTAKVALPGLAEMPVMPVRGESGSARGGPSASLQLAHVTANKREQFQITGVPTQ